MFSKMLGRLAVRRVRQLECLIADVKSIIAFLINFSSDNHRLVAPGLRQGEDDPGSRPKGRIREDENVSGSLGNGGWYEKDKAGIMINGV